MEISEKLKAIIQEIDELTVIELAELVKAVEDRFGVSAQTTVIGSNAPTAQAEVLKEEQTEFEVVITDVGTTRVPVIKVLREVTTLGLAEAKSATDKVPVSVKSGITKEEAEKIKEALVAVGATVEIK